MRENLNYEKIQLKYISMYIPLQKSLKQPKYIFRCISGGYNTF